MSAAGNGNTPTRAPKPVILITGTSHGLGAAMARRLGEWATVYGTSRSSLSPGGHLTLKMDVTDSESVQAAVATVLSEQGRIDVLINNAGIVLSGAGEYTPLESIARQMEVNYLGAVRMTQAVLPTMRQRGGLILNLSSMAAAIPLPFRAAYAASKAALEAWMWGVRLEVRPFRIAVCCVQAGDCHTDLSHREAAEFPTIEQGGYAAMHQVAHARYRRDEAEGLNRDRLAQVIEGIIKQPAHRLHFRYTAGRWSQRILFRCRHALPDWVIELLIRQLYLTGQ